MSLIGLLGAPWAILPERLQDIQSIYAAHVRGEQPDIPAIEARLGRPLANEQPHYQVTKGGVAVLPIDGVIAPKANLFTRVSGGVSADMLIQELEAAAADSTVRSILQVIDSPGGSVHGTPEYAARVLEVGKTKPVVTLATASMASAAYWIGSAANAVFISGPTVLVGSIGVVATHDYSPREKGQRTEVTAGTYKRIASSEAPLTMEGRAYIQAQVDHLYSVFVDAVALHRGTTVDAVLKGMADGRIFVGQQAIDAGLVDGIKPLAQLLADMGRDPDQFAMRRRAGQAAPNRPAPAPTPTRPPAAAQGTGNFAASAPSAFNAAPASASIATPHVPQHPIDACLARSSAADTTAAVIAVQEGMRLYGSAWRPMTRTRSEWEKIALAATDRDGGDAYTAMHREGFIGQRSVFVAAPPRTSSMEVRPAAASATPPVLPGMAGKGLHAIDACMARTPAADATESVAAIREGARLYGAAWTPRTRTRTEWEAIARLAAELDGVDAYTAMHREGFIGQRSVCR